MSFLPNQKEATIFYGVKVFQQDTVADQINPFETCSGSCFTRMEPHKCMEDTNMFYLRPKDTIVPLCIYNVLFFTLKGYS